MWDVNNLAHGLFNYSKLAHDKILNVWVYGVSGAGTLVSQEQIHKEIHSENAKERREALNQLCDNFSVFLDKKQAWDDLIWLMQSKHLDLLFGKKEIFGIVFPHMPDKKQAWQDIIRLIQSKDTNVRWSVAGILGIIFPHASDKNQAWQDIMLLTQDEDATVRRGAAYSLGIAFKYFPNKEQAWEDMHNLVEDKDEAVRCGIAHGIGVAFAYISTKEQAWEDLRQLIQDKYREVRWNTAEGVNIAFPHIPDKKQAWEDLYQLAKNDEDLPMRFHVVGLLGDVFSYVHDKKWALDDLIRLTTDEVSILRVSANYSLGRASIFKAIEAKDKESFKKELEKAVEFFEKSSIESQYFKPASFCFPFYKSFYTITFKRQRGHTELQKCITEAKKTVRGSESKRKLLEVIENLANALKEAQTDRDFNEMKRNLSAYRRYCERAADLLSETEERAPGAAKLIKKGLPIINERIEELINEINKDAKILCDAARGSEAEKYTNPICKEVKEFTKIRNPIELEKRVNGLIPNLIFMAENLPEKEGNFINSKIENIRKEVCLEDVFVHLNEIIVFVTPHIKTSKDMEILENKIDAMMVSLKPGIREELVITVGAEFAGTGAKHEIHIPLQEITYPDIKKDLEKIKNKSILKLTTLPSKLAEKVRDYLIQNKLLR